jgi:hypothetical protein
VYGADNDDVLVQGGTQESPQIIPKEEKTQKQRQIELKDKRTHSTILYRRVPSNKVKQIKINGEAKGGDPGNPSRCERRQSRRS